MNFTGQDALRAQVTAQQNSFLFDDCKTHTQKKRNIMYLKIIIICQQQVWSGSPDPEEKLLNPVFTLVPEKSDTASEDILTSDIAYKHYGEEFNENSKISNGYGTTEYTEDAVRIENPKITFMVKSHLCLQWRTRALLTQCVP